MIASMLSLEAVQRNGHDKHLRGINFPLYMLATCNKFPVSSSGTLFKMPTVYLQEEVISMGNRGHIECTDTTWNPVTGCTKVSQGCIVTRNAWPVACKPWVHRAIATGFR